MPKDPARRRITTGPSKLPRPKKPTGRRGTGLPRLESEEQYRTLVEKALDGILIIQDGLVGFANPRLAELWGGTVEEILGHSFTEFVMPDQISFIRERYLMRMRGDPVSSVYEMSLRKKDGGPLEVEFNANTITLGGRLADLVVVRDVTARKTAEAALCRRLGLEELVAEISTAFAAADPDAAGGAIDAALARLGAFAGVDRVSMFEIRPDGVLMDMTHEWCAPGVEAQTLNYHALRLDRFPWWMERLRAGWAIPISRVKDLPPEAQAEKDILQTRGVVSRVVVPLTSREKLIGYLGFDSIRAETPWAAEDVRLLQVAGSIIVGGLERARSFAHLKQLLEEKEVMLREIHHRVKNNMQLVSSLIRLQAQRVADPGLLMVYESCQQRIRSIALVHEQLYRASDLARVDFPAYLDRLIGQLSLVHHERLAAIDLRVEAHDVKLDINRAIPCGLIINELVSNAFRHAFAPGRSGRIVVRMSQDGAGATTLTVADTGIGLPEDVDLFVPLTLGLQIVRDLVDQLGGTLDVRREGGTEVVVAFP
jgi:PAS domain S-box-containing protein